MPDKVKRKTNPRRRLLLRLCLGIVILSIFVAGAITYLQPTYGYQYCEFISPDGKRCAYNMSDGFDPIGPELVSIFNSGSSRRLIIPLDHRRRPEFSNLSTVTAFFHGWHPNNNQFLISEYVREIVDGEYNFIGVNLNLYDLQTREFITISSVPEEVWYGLASFNSDGSEMVINRASYNTNETDQLIHFDLITGEETVLPLFGTQPQWVNGGR
ncbi:MAG: hypothetical protein WBC91_15840 [Phototrophicaceae bacterium]